MGFGVSDWRLASTVSKLGQLGVISGTALDAVLSRKLQDGDPEGHVRRALEYFPFSRVAKRVLDSYFIEGGRKPDQPYRHIPMHTMEGSQEAIELCVAGNFVEAFLAMEGHSRPVGINYLEKIQLPHLPSIYGAMLAGVSTVIMGAGIPLTVPGILDDLARHRKVKYPITVAGIDGCVETVDVTFDPMSLMDGRCEQGVMKRPDFYPVVTTDSLASILLKKSNGSIEGFIVESNLAGGHNAPPRGRGILNDSGEPVYGPRDRAKLGRFRDLGVPFWLAGLRGSPEGLRDALEHGASGVQVGTAFGLCAESGLLPEVRQELVRAARSGQARVFTDPLASPTGFPFKVADVAGSLSESAVYEDRKRICDVGFLRQPYRKEDGGIGYRCPAEPVAAYVAKGGKKEDTVGRKCLCNALAANIGCPQHLSDGTTEKTLVTMGDDLQNMGRFAEGDSAEFSAADVMRIIMDK